ncbi:MAG: hypothetical protein WEA56_07475 [Balneolaceae bacterium]
MRSLKVILTLLFITLALGIYTEVNAQDRYSNTELGVILGEPTGISLKAWQSNTTAIDAAFAWSFSGNESVHIHADYLWHNWLEAETGGLNLYYGIGARALLSDNSKAGARIPVGLQYLIPDNRLSFFFEVAPTLNVIPDTDFDVSGGLGIRLFL